jgi:hypothetical protein
LLAEVWNIQASVEDFPSPEDCLGGLGLPGGKQRVSGNHLADHREFERAE